MKVIFLDIDGVLNYGGCNSRSPSGCLGIQDEKVILLKQIVDATNAKIVLTSTWKTEWFRCEFEEDLPKDGKYLQKKFRNNGLFILEKTQDPEWAKRGEGILSFINKYNVESFVILDDERFDFKKVGIDKYHVKTSFVDGLMPLHVQKAINILNAPIEKSIKKEDR